MAVSAKRNPLLPWYIGIVIIAIADAFIAYKFYAVACEIPGIIEAIVLLVVPGVYLVLMYMAFKSQP